MKEKKLRVLSLFSWAWWLDLWFINAWFDIVWSNDFFKEAVETYKKNIWDHIVLWDITKIPSSEMPDDIDVVIWWFPCQWFSIANIKRSMEDKRNFLYKEMLRVIHDKKPKVFVAENVKWILNMAWGKVFEMIKQDFTDLWYTVTAHVLNAAEYWVPQTRERVVIIWNRIWVENIYPKKTHYILPEDKKAWLKPAVTAQEAIWFLADVPTRDKPFELNWQMIYNHQAATNVADTFWWRKYDVNQPDICDYLKYWRAKSWWTTKRVDDHFWYAYTAWHWFRKDNNSWSIPSPSDWWELKKILGFDDKYDKEVTTLVEKEIQFEQSLRITNWDRPSDTITATSPEIHVNKMRRLSARECAIIQTFPMDFEFVWSLNRIYTQIGNAVPVLLATKVAECVKKMLNSKQ